MFQENGIPGAKTGSNRTGGPFGQLWVVWGNSEVGKRLPADMTPQWWIHKDRLNNEL